MSTTPARCKDAPWSIRLNQHLPTFASLKTKNLANSVMARRALAELITVIRSLQRRRC